MMTEGEINRALGHQRITREIRQLNGHVIVCGFGRVGETLATQLRDRKQQFVIIDNDAERIAEATNLGCLAVNDDADLERVRGIFDRCLPEDENFSLFAALDALGEGPHSQ